MVIRCVWEHNGEDTLLFAENFIGAYTRGPSRELALSKMEDELAAWLRWVGEKSEEDISTQIVQEKVSTLHIRDADTDVIFDSERLPMELGEYQARKALCLKSAKDFLTLYESVPDKDKTALSPRETFYGPIPRTAREMYEHTKNVNSYYFGEIGVEAGNEGSILTCREDGFAALEAQPDFLHKPVSLGSYEEEWSLRKLLRRFIWHDRIHARAMYRMGERAFGPGVLADPFCFGG